MIPPKPRDAVELTTRDLEALLVPDERVHPDVVVTVAVHGSEHDLSRCFTSVAEQDLDIERLGMVVLLDSPLQCRFSPLIPARLHGRTWVLRANCGTPARARNAMLEFVEQRLPWCKWIARMDWDDRFAESASLRMAVDAGESANADFVVGGNRVLDRAGCVLRINSAGAWLHDTTSLLERLRQMASDSADNELPSCNLLIRGGTRVRYPDTSSAEDHWLVSDLLMHQTSRVAIVDAVPYADYTLDGHCTSHAKHTHRHRAARVALYEAAQTWQYVRGMRGIVLGLGQEGIVRVHDGAVTKHFYPGILAPDKVQWLERALSCGQAIVPKPVFSPGHLPESWTATYPWEPTRPFDSVSVDAIAAFLEECLQHKLVCGNIKRSNFRVLDNGRLSYIDIGNWIVPMDVSVLRDSAARLYSIGVLGASDEELLRRPADHSRAIIWDRLPGYAELYGRTVSRHIESRWQLSGGRCQAAPPCMRRSDVSLLIKACAMDSRTVEAQVTHLIQQFVGPSDFAERVLAIDPHEGPFVRQHSAGDLDALLASAHTLLAKGVIDRVLVCPADSTSVRTLNTAWFGLESSDSRTCDGIPVAPQLWAFEQITTRYVLQCDVDIIVGRRDRSHDYLHDMITAAQPPDVISVAFNIPHDPISPPNPYRAEPGEFKPEVRCGLIDLGRLKATMPLPNRLIEGRLEHPWYRALHSYQRVHGRRTLRGGDPRTFYIHPLNTIKSDPDVIGRVRDLTAQGLVPRSHWDRWDVGRDVADWRYPSRDESVVVIARGRDTPLDKVDRFAAGLEMQSDQSFGVVVIDDASSDTSPAYLEERLRFLGNRITLIRHARSRGRMLNNVIAIREVCTNPESAIAVVDLDDSLADSTAMKQVRELFRLGHDVVLAAPFRPDVPTKVYHPNFENPRGTFGGDVWIHLRAFAKHLFDRLPDELLQVGGDWLQVCDDYAIMIPIVEMASSPIYVPEFWYWHERMTGSEPLERDYRRSVISHLLLKSPVSERGRTL
jgi:hypothetical protein